MAAYDYDPLGAIAGLQLPSWMNEYQRYGDQYDESLKREQAEVNAQRDADAENLRDFLKQRYGELEGQEAPGNVISDEELMQAIGERTGDPAMLLRAKQQQEQEASRKIQQQAQQLLYQKNLEELNDPTRNDKTVGGDIIRPDGQGGYSTIFTGRHDERPSRYPASHVLESKDGERKSVLAYSPEDMQLQTEGWTKVSSKQASALDDIIRQAAGIGDPSPRPAPTPAPQVNYITKQINGRTVKLIQVGPDQFKEVR